MCKPPWEEASASPHCAASPDGKLVATLFSSSVGIRSVETLQTVATVPLPPEIVAQTNQSSSSASLATVISAFSWSVSSRRVLIALADEIHVFSPEDPPNYHAAIRHLVPGKPAVVQFGAGDTDVCVFSAFGLKFSLFDLTSSRSIEIANPKFYQGPSAAARGVSFRPGTAHLAILTRDNGKDVVSIHHPVSYGVQASWHPDTVDAQALAWTPNGRWLTVTESASQGHRILFYAPDGNLFRVWTGSTGVSSAIGSGDGNNGVSGTETAVEIERMAAGVKAFYLSHDSRLGAACDHTRCISVLDLDWTPGSEVLRLTHPTSIEPRDTLQIWQEQLLSQGARRNAAHSFVRASQAIIPPCRDTGGGTAAPGTSLSSATSEPKSGCSVALFDSSSALLASQIEEADSTVWVWDLKTAELRAALVFHATVASVAWHPRIPELLMIVCAGDAHRDVVFAWDPVSSGPRPIEFGGRLPLPGAKAVAAGGSRKARAAWLDIDEETAGVLVGDGERCLVVSLADADAPPAGWAGGEGAFARGFVNVIGGGDDGDDSPADDTFAFKRG